MSLSEEKQKSYTPGKAKQIKKYQQGLRAYRDGFFACMRLFLMCDEQIPKEKKQRWLDSLSDSVFDIVMEYLEGKKTS